jgi:hypothetical protein
MLHRSLHVQAQTKDIPCLLTNLPPSRAAPRAVREVRTAVEYRRVLLQVGRMERLLMIYKYYSISLHGRHEEVLLRANGRAQLLCSAVLIVLYIQVLQGPECLLKSVYAMC